MNLQEKQAWFILGVVAVTASLFCGVGFAVGFKPWTTGFLGIFGITGFAPFIGMTQRGRGEVLMDERDASIGRRAASISFSVIWIFFVAALMTPFFVGKQSITLPVWVLSSILMCASMLLYAVQSIAILWLYRTDRNAL